MGIVNKVWGRGNLFSGLWGKASGITSNVGNVVERGEKAASGLTSTAEELIQKFGIKGEDATYVRKIMSDAAGGVAGAMKDEAKKGGFKTFLKSGAVLLGIGTAVVKTGALQGAASAVYTQNENAEKIAGVHSKFTGFYQFIADFLKMFGLENTALGRWADRKLEGNKGILDKVVDAVKDNPGTAAALGATGLGALAVAGPALTAAAGLTTGALALGKRILTGSAAAPGLISDARKPASSRFTETPESKASFFTPDEIKAAQKDVDKFVAKSERGFMSRILHSGTVKHSVAGTLLVGGATFLGSMYAGSSAAEAGQKAVEIAVPFTDSFEKAAAGDNAGAAKSATMEAIGWAGFAAGAAASTGIGASWGAAVGTAIPVPVVGTVAGAVVGGAVGLTVGVVTSTAAETAANYVWDGISSWFNWSSDPDDATRQAAAPSQTPAPTREPGYLLAMH